MRTFIAVVVLAALAGCASNEAIQRRVDNETQGQPEAYKAGYRDGCTTAFAETYPAPTEAEARRDEQRMRSDREYEIGWNTGRMKCATGGGATVVPMRR